MPVLRLILSIVPLALTTPLGYLIAEGYLNFGGGEKDLLFVRNPLQVQFNAKRFLVDRFEITRAESSMYFYCCTDHTVC